MATIINAVTSEQTIASLNANQKSTLEAFSAKFKELVAASVSTTHAEESTTPLVSFAPGRINLIGEHVDYLGGNVLPAAIDKGIFSFGLALSSPPKNVSAETAEKSRTWTFICHDGKEVESFIETVGDQSQLHLALNPSRDESKKVPRWARYVIETFNQLVISPSSNSAPSSTHQHTYVAIFSNLPVGAGLSSSAAFNISVANLVVGLKTKTSVRSKALPPAGAFTRKDAAAISTVASGSVSDDLLAYSSRLNIALLAQKTEHRTGTMCGIMDQLASLFGAPSTCLLTDCDLCQVSPVSLQKLSSRGVSFLLINSIVAHELGDAYNKLRQALERAQNALTAFFGGAEPFSAVQWAKKELTQHGKLQNEIKKQQRPAEIADEIGKKLMRIAIDEAKASPEDALKLSYVAAETCRTVLFCSLLVSENEDDDNNSDLEEQLGELMNGTHEGLSKILNVSTPELDFIHEYLEKRENMNRVSKEFGDVRCFGSRMMGGGFGGCVLCLVKSKNGSESIQKFMAESADFMPVFGKKFFPMNEEKRENFEGVWYDVLTGGGASLLM